MKYKNIYILYGGPSSEREVSFKTKDYFFNLYKEYNPILVEWLGDFRFRLHSHPGTQRSEVIGSKTYKEGVFYKKLSKENCVVIIAGHGEYIEDGYLQEKLALHQIPFTGSSSSACMLSMDKYETFEALKEIVTTYPVYKTKVKDFSYELLIKYVGKNYPIFIKPNNLGSSIGVYKVKSKKELLKVIKNLENDEILFQRSVEGVEVSNGVVRLSSEYLNLPITQIIPKNEFFDYGAKYIEGLCSEITPALISKKLTTKLAKQTAKIHQKLGLGFYSRSDFIVSKNGKIFYLETNSLPGMTKTSLLPQQIAAVNKVGLFKKQLLKNTVPVIRHKKRLLKIPYFSQFTLPKNNDLARGNNWKNVPNGFKKSGAININDYIDLSNNLCGTACLQMIFGYFELKEEKLFDIYYKLSKKFYLDIGLDYRNIQNFLNLYKLKSRVYRTGLTLDQICFHLDNKEIPILSVGTLNILKDSKQAKSGHLVVATGYDLKEQSLFLHDPSGSLANNTCKNREIPFDLFSNIYSYKGFVVSS